MIHFRPVEATAFVRPIETEWDVQRQRSMAIWRDLCERQPDEVIHQEIAATLGAMLQFAGYADDPLTAGDHYGSLQVRCYATAMLSDREIVDRVISQIGRARS
jgi:hypothetical protein